MLKGWLLEPIALACSTLVPLIITSGGYRRLLGRIGGLLDRLLGRIGGLLDGDYWDVSEDY